MARSIPPCRRKKIEYIKDANGCFICTSHALNSNGYPKSGNSTIMRVVYEVLNGEIPKGKILRHTCDNRKCINPDHLLIGTHLDNVMDCITRGRNSRGEIHGCSKLKTDQVLAIFESQEAVGVLARRYKVTHETIWNIWNRKAWKHILSEKEIKHREEVHSGAKLKANQVVEIFDSQDDSKLLAERYGVTRESINSIKRGATWKRVLSERLKDRIKERTNEQTEERIYKTR